MCAWNRWVEKVSYSGPSVLLRGVLNRMESTQNAPGRIHPRVARKYTLGFVDEYFDFLDERGLHPFFVVHMTVGPQLYLLQIYN
jgi:hypothetical protein